MGEGLHPAARSQPLTLCHQLTREFFTKELTKHYQGNNDTDIFSATWNSVMITVSDHLELPGPGHLLLPVPTPVPDISNRPQPSSTLHARQP